MYQQPPNQPQQTGYPQQNTYYPPQQPWQPPSRPPKKRRRLWLVLAIVGGLLLLTCIATSVIASTLPQPPQVAQVIPTTAPTKPPTHVIQVAAAKPTIRPTIKPTSKPGGIAVTHGQPHLGGSISDFYGKFGASINGVQTNGDGSSSVSWLLDPNNADGGDILLTHYSGSSQSVNYIAYNGPSTWSKAQYKQYFISTFAPSGTTEDTQTNSWWASQGGDPYDPIAYTSSIGKFFLHISDGTGYMNTVS